jgi:hypothetical protein
MSPTRLWFRNDYTENYRSVLCKYLKIIPMYVKAELIAGS